MRETKYDGTPSLLLKATEDGQRYQPSEFVVDSFEPLSIPRFDPPFRTRETPQSPPRASAGLARAQIKHLDVSAGGKRIFLHPAREDPHTPVKPLPDERRKDLLDVVPVARRAHERLEHAADDVVIVAGGVVGRASADAAEEVGREPEEAEDDAVLRWRGRGCRRAPFTDAEVVC